MSTLSRDEVIQKLALAKATGCEPNFCGVDLSYCILSNIDLSEANLTRANLTYSMLCNADLSNADLSYADLFKANLSNAQLKEANLSNADLANANLTCTDLYDANLSYANLISTNLSGANLTYTNLTDTKLWATIGNGKEIFSLQTDIWHVTWTKDVLQIGCQQYPIKAWCKFSDTKIASMDPDALAWCIRWKPILREAIANTVGL